ncbi:MAG: nucleoside/nucleotide kinase family protein [Patescibacteria group bacterium]
MEFMYGEKLHRDNFRVSVIDGIDGSGKGSATEEMADIISGLGYNVLTVDYPQYEALWGQIIQKLLSRDDSSIDIYQRMAIYALNRLETVPTLKTQLSNFKVPTYVLFDRFITSNAMTCAYYSKKDPSILRDIDSLYHFMFDLDSTFLASLQISDFHVVVPTIDHEKAVQAVEEDSGRSGADLYEQSDVLRLGNRIYSEFAALDPQRFTLLNQDSKDGIRMSKGDIAREIIRIQFGKIETYVHRKGQVSKFQFDQSSVDTSLFQGILDRFPALRMIDPYG